jgi:diamine N-acetyltransferase
MLNFITASQEHIPIIQHLAEKTWWPTYSSIISKEQIEYMLKNIYSSDALKKAITSGAQNFILLEDDNSWQGFASYGLLEEDQTICKLHKLYVLPENQGKGYGKKLIEEVKRRAAALGITILELNVNRYNKAKHFYEKLGFKVVREEDISIGPYWMNDFVLRTEIRTIV